MSRPPPKGVIQKSAFNPHSSATHSYNTIQDIAMSSSTL